MSERLQPPVAGAAEDAAWTRWLPGRELAHDGAAKPGRDYVVRQPGPNEGEPYVVLLEDPGDVEMQLNELGQVGLQDSVVQAGQ